MAVPLAFKRCYRYTNADLKIYQFRRLYINMLKILHLNIFYFLRDAHVRYVYIHLFTYIQKQ